MHQLSQNFYSTTALYLCQAFGVRPQVHIWYSQKALPSERTRFICTADTPPLLPSIILSWASYHVWNATRVVYVVAYVPTKGSSSTLKQAIQSNSPSIPLSTQSKDQPLLDLGSMYFSCMVSDEA
uniref:Ig-like domain-containing protein n=1 Tax=Eutreptiella gymnastica TaxID=73025 RepID=A0A7S4FNH1_9EUGL|mmetsp:Transcript_1021/g.1501  ORF Transcript_1021/g.1501 Transcript_1021/m.1501 type:complete len:125 (-) Transcript_1021:368-742(-)